MPEAPYGLKVLDKSGRSVQLSWAAPYDGNSPIKKFLIEYKRAKGSWEKDIDRWGLAERELLGEFIRRTISFRSLVTTKELTERKRVSKVP